MQFDHIMSFLNDFIKGSTFAVTTQELQQFCEGQLNEDNLTQEKLEEIIFVRDFKALAKKATVTNDLLQYLEATYDPQDF